MPVNFGASSYFKLLSRSEQMRGKCHPEIMDTLKKASKPENDFFLFKIKIKCYKPYKRKNLTNNTNNILQ